MPVERNKKQKFKAKNLGQKAYDVGAVAMQWKIHKFKTKFLGRNAYDVGAHCNAMKKNHKFKTKN